MEVLSRWAADPLVRLLLGVGGILIGILVSHVYYRKGLKEKIPRYFVDSYFLLDQKQPTPKGLTIQFNGIQLSQVTISKVCIWNAGREAIRHSDVPSGGLQIIPPIGAQVLAVDVARVSDAACRPTISISSVPSGQNVAELEFEYLDRNDAVVAEIVHTGGRDGEMVVQGKIIGSRAISRMGSWPHIRSIWEPAISIVSIIGMLWVIGRMPKPPMAGQTGYDWELYLWSGAQLIAVFVIFVIAGAYAKVMAPDRPLI